MTSDLECALQVEKPNWLKLAPQRVKLTVALAIVASMTNFLTHFWALQITCNADFVAELAAQGWNSGLLFELWPQ
jgi:hypothetical protein